MVKVTREELIQAFQKSKVTGGDEAQLLDELVCEVVSGEAAAINNQGIEFQVDYLMGMGLTTEEIASEITPLVDTAVL